MGWGGPGRPWVGCGYWCGVWAGGPLSSLSPHGWSAPGGHPILLRKQPIWAAGDSPHLMPVEQGLPWHPVAMGLAGSLPPMRMLSHLLRSEMPEPHMPPGIRVLVNGSTPSSRSCLFADSLLQVPISQRNNKSSCLAHAQVLFVREDAAKVAVFLQPRTGNGCAACP